MGDERLRGGRLIAENGTAFATRESMARKLAEQPLAEVLEHGKITFLYRPRVEEQQADELGEVQRLLVLLAPQANSFQRLLAIGRKRIPRSAKRDRFWGFVDLVLTPRDMSAALDLQIYAGTSTASPMTPSRSKCRSKTRPTTC
jgi:hypothetical protein